MCNWNLTSEKYLTANNRPWHQSVWVSSGIPYSHLLDTFIALHCTFIDFEIAQKENDQNVF